MDKHTDFSESELRTVTIERFQAMGLAGDHLEMAVAQQRGEWFSDYEMATLCPRCEQESTQTDTTSETP